MSARPTLFARTVARALKTHLRNNQADAHWVCVVGENSLAIEPTVQWPTEVDPMLNVMIQDGRSEGCVLCIYAQADRYKPQNVSPLLGIKFLCDKRRVGQFLTHVFDFLDGLQDHPDLVLESYGNKA